MGSVGNVNKSNSVLGVQSKSRAVDIDSDMMHAMVNPNFGADRGYDTNCALCVVAAELNARGYNVEAAIRDNVWRGSSDIFDLASVSTDDALIPARTWARYSHLSGSVSWKTRTQVGNQITKKMTSWGDGSRAIFTFEWSGYRSAHTINLVNRGGTVYAVDTQSGKRMTLNQYLSTRPVKPSTAAVIRSDNLKIKSNLDKSVIDKMLIIH